MNKKVIIVMVVIAMLSAAFALPNVIFAQSGTFQEAVSNFNSAKQTLQTETTAFKEKVQTVKSLSGEVRNLLKEKKENGKEIPENVKEDLKKLRVAQLEIRKSILIRDARSEYAKNLLTKIKTLRKEIEQKKNSGETKENLKPLREKMRKLFTDLHLVAPLSPERMLKNSDKIMEKAESLNKNGKEKEAIRLLDKTTNEYKEAANALKTREEKINEMITLLNKIKGELSQ